MARTDVAARLVALGAMRYEPIVTLWLDYPSRTDMPGPVRSRGSTADVPEQWMIEAPVRSGIAAAEALLADTASP